MRFFGKSKDAPKEAPQPHAPKTKDDLNKIVKRDLQTKRDWKRHHKNRDKQFEERSEQQQTRITSAAERWARNKASYVNLEGSKPRAPKVEEEAKNNEAETKTTPSETSETPQWAQSSKTLYEERKRETIESRLSRVGNTHKLRPETHHAGAHNESKPDVQPKASKNWWEVDD